MQWKSNKLTDLKKQYADDLYEFYEREEANTILSILIKSFFGFSRIDMALNPEFRLSESEMLKLHFAVKELKDYKPVQYIIKKTDFLNVRLMVNESVLIPRPETEEMVSLIIDREKEEGLHVLDMGTGSGCIAIALAKNLKNPEVWAVDISAEALATASKNTFFNEVMIHLSEFNMLGSQEAEKLGDFDIIVSNPPYVTESDKVLIKENVIRFEPHKALFVPGDDALLFYRAILYFAGEHLVKNGRIYLEINERYGEKVTGLLSAQGYTSVELFKDIHGKNRFVCGMKG